MSTIPKSSLSVFEDLKNYLKELKIREDKCKMFFPEVPEDFDANIPISRVGIDVLGSPIDTSNYSQSKRRAAAMEGSSLCSS